MEMTMNEYKQTTNVRWKASIIAQDAHGNTCERGIIVYADSISQALEYAKEDMLKYYIEPEWERWMIFDIGIVPDDCFN